MDMLFSGKTPLFEIFPLTTKSTFHPKKWCTHSLFFLVRNQNFCFLNGKLIDYSKFPSLLYVTNLSSYMTHTQSNFFWKALCIVCPPTLFLTNLFLTKCWACWPPSLPLNFWQKLWIFRFWNLHFLYYPYYFLRVRGTDM